MTCRSRIILFVLLALIALLLMGCQGKMTTLTTPTASGGDFAASGPAAGEQIKALGVIRPAQKVALGFTTGGAVGSVKVQVGMEVKAGHILAELDTTSLQFELGKAKEVVTLRQAELDALLSGPDATLAERAEAEHAQKVAEAEIALRMARLQLEEARLQQQTEQQAHVQAVAMAQSKLEQLDLQVTQAGEQSPTAEVVAAQVDLARAQDVLDTAQEEYQKALDRHWEPEWVRDAYAKAVWRAEQDLKLAQARLGGALDAQRAHALGLQALAAQRDAAAMQLTQTLEAQVAYTTTFARLEAELDRAQLQLDGLQAWQNPYLDPPPPEEVVQARALLRQAELAAEELEWQLQGTQLYAPFDGVVSAVYPSPGEWAGPGTPVVELVDTTQWRVETRNVGELEIGRVRLGQEALVRVNAFRGETLHGRVATISPVAVVQQGDTTYTLMIELEATELNLRPGMTVQVEILTE